MHKYIFILALFFILSFPVMANMDYIGEKPVTEHKQPNKQIENQNQAEIKNHGEGTQIHQGTPEQETTVMETPKEGTREAGQNRNEEAVLHMSAVATQVQQLLQVRTEGGIGKQVRQIAREQNQAQTQIQTQLNNLDSKNQLLRLLTGTDFGAVKNLQVQIEQNQLRIKQLQELQSQLTNSGDITLVQTAIQTLTDQNTALQDKINLEEQSFSVFGWLFKLLAK